MTRFAYTYSRYRVSRAGAPRWRAASSGTGCREREPMEHLMLGVLDAGGGDRARRGGDAVRGPAAEFEMIRRHAAIGAEMLAGRDFLLLEMAERIALTHHERWEGAGYPAGLAREAIPLDGRIVALADVFDALTQDRRYRSTWTFKDPIAEVRAQRGGQFDPALVDAFLDLVGGADRPTSATPRSRGVPVSPASATGS